MVVALVSKADLPNGSEDDKALRAALERVGTAATVVSWDDARVRWTDFEAIVVRSTWDYHLRLPGFLAWADRAGASGRLWNPPAVIRWNAHKRYLKELEARGVPIVPTQLSRDLEEALRHARSVGWRPAVLKPAVSAGGYRTYLVADPEGSVEDLPWAEGRPEGEVLAQPYLPEVERSGERSLVYVAGRFSHAFLRAPHLVKGSPLREGTPVIPTDAELDLGRKAMAAAPSGTLYARVDLVAPTGSPPCLMELELIEPYLGLRSSKSAAGMLAREIVRRTARPEGSRSRVESPG